MPFSQVVILFSFFLGPSPPTDLTTHTLNSSAIRVSWQIPWNPNGEIFYRLYYWQNSKGPGSGQLIYDGPLLEYIVAGLYGYVTYTFMLLAYNVRFEWSSTAVNASETTHPAGKLFFYTSTACFMI